MKKLVLIFLLFIVINVDAATRFWVGGGATANWNATGPTNWAATSGGANNQSVPGASDDVTFDGVGTNGNTSSTESAIITVLSLTITSGYTATITHNAVVTVAGNLTLGANYTIAGASGITISATSTIAPNGKVWPNSMTFSAAATYTISTLLTVLGTLQLPDAAVTIAGTGGFTVGTLSSIASAATRTYTFNDAATFTITTAFNAFQSRVGAILVITSDDAVNKVPITLQQGATCNVFASLTRVDASGGKTIWAFNGTITTCTNVLTFTDQKTVIGGTNL